MKKYKSDDLIDELQSDIRRMIEQVSILRAADPGLLLTEPATGKWSVIEVLEHLNSYDRYYLTAIEKAMAKDLGRTEYFRPGWLGEYFTRMMKPGEDGKIGNKMQSPKDHRPAKGLDVFPVLKDFVDRQIFLLELLDQARQKNLGKIRVPISIFKSIRLKLGDTFRFLVAHKQRHFVQINKTIATVGGFKDRYQANHRAEIL